jgi:adenylate cyclase
MPAAISCTTCGTELRASARFCDQCGAPTTATTEPAEYKQVTVLFADVVHSMSIAAAVGPERLREIMTELAGRATAVVRRYGGTVAKFTGDGIMAMFGAPRALEDHALRACLAALDIQNENRSLATEISRRDGITLQLRVGLNSGQVIAGEIGSGPLGYTAVGEQVGLAQRMESVAPPGGVMLNESTARLVEHAAVLGPPELVAIKGSDQPVPVRLLLATVTHHLGVGRQESVLVGRSGEIATIDAHLDNAIRGQGSVVGLVGPAGIGKSRIVREVTAMAAARGVNAFSTCCESVASEIPFHVVMGLLRAVTGVTDLDAAEARAKIRAQMPVVDEQDLMLLNDVLAIHKETTVLPKIDPDARRRRLTALVKSASLAQTAPALYIVEDAHWIDEASESMLADYIAVVPQTHATVLLTYRPEYRGRLARMAGGSTIALGPLTDSNISALINELLGPDPSVSELATKVVARAAGNPFFAEEMVRDLTERGVLDGRRGDYVCRSQVDEISVPATLQATIAARIDRLHPDAKRTLSAASVIGTRFSTELLARLGDVPVLDELVDAELIFQMKSTPRAGEYAFHHPLIRTVAYESQLKTDRAELHRRLAAAIETGDAQSTEENAAVIAEHLEAAGELHGAYWWHMRAGKWSTNRDIATARLNWERARQVADALATDDPERAPMRIGARTLLCASGWRRHETISGVRFEELRQLCNSAGDKASLAIGMAGLVMEHMLHGRLPEASDLATEYMALIEAIGDPTLTVGLSFAAISPKIHTGELADVLRWAQHVIDLADGDPSKGNLIVGSPLAAALAWRGLGRWATGRRGWQKDFDDAVAMARSTDPMTLATVITYKYAPAIPRGVLLANDAALGDLEEALGIAERSGDDIALDLTRLALGVALVHRGGPHRERGLEILADVRQMSVHGHYTLAEVPLLDIVTAKDKAGHGDLDSAVLQLRKILDDLYHGGHLALCDLATEALVEALLARRAEGDLQEAESVTDRLAAEPANDGAAVIDILLLRLRALLAHAGGDSVGYREFVGRHRAMALSLGFEGHLSPSQTKASGSGGALDLAL